MKRTIVVAQIIASLCALSLPAEANGVAFSVLPQPDAPVEILGCSGSVGFFDNRFGTYGSNLNTQADFRNISSKTAVAVLIHFQLDNPFGNIMDNIFGSATGQFAPDAPIKGNHWSNTDTWPGLGDVKCSVARVLFSDGSEWLEPKLVPAAQKPSAAPSV